MDYELYLQSLSEDRLHEQVLRPLFVAMGYDVRLNHGQSERGKDFILTIEEPTRGLVYTSVVVKCHPITGAVSSSRGLREIMYQVQQSFALPFVDPTTRQKHFMHHVFLITPFHVTDKAVEDLTIQSNLPVGSMTVLDGHNLVHRIRRYKPDILELSKDKGSRFCRFMYRSNLYLKLVQSLGHLRETPLLDIYTGGKLHPRYMTGGMTGGDQHNSSHLAEVLSRHKRLLLIDEPGKGKSTSLQKFMLSTVYSTDTGVRATPTRYCAHFYLPTEPIGTFRNADTVKMRVLEQFTEMGVENSNEIFPEQVVLVIDAFDEVRSKMDQDKIAKAIEGLTNDAPELDVVIATRPSSIPVLPGFIRFELDSFASEDILEFLKKWYKEPGKAHQLHRRIFAAPSTLLRDVASNPLGLTIVAILNQTDTDITRLTSMSDIYSRFTRILLADWARMKGVEVDFDSRELMAIVSFVAYKLHVTGARQFRRDLLEQLVAEALSDMVFATKSQAGIVEHVLTKTGLLVEINEGTFQFWHLSFQEFLYAFHVHRHSITRAEKSMVEQPWFRNAALFYAGLAGDIEKMIKQYAKILITLENIPFLSKLLQEASSTPFSLKSQLFRQIVSRYGNHPETKLWKREMVGFSDVLYNELATVDLARSKSLIDSLICSLSYKLDVREKKLLELMTQREDIVAAAPGAFVIAFSQCLSESACTTALYLYKKYNCQEAAEELLSAVWMRGYGAFKKMEHELENDRRRQRFYDYTLSEIRSHSEKETTKDFTTAAGKKARRHLDEIVESSISSLRDYPQKVAVILEELLSLKKPASFTRSLQYFVSVYKDDMMLYYSQIHLRKREIRKLSKRLGDLKTVKRKSSREDLKRLEKSVADGHSLSGKDRTRLKKYRAIFEMIETESGQIKVDKKYKANPSKSIDVLRSHLESQLTAFQEDPIPVPEVVTLLEHTYKRVKDLLRPQPF